MIDLKKALLDPPSVFSSPNEVLAQDDISNEDKLKILQQWEYDCKELETAEDENMPDSGYQPDILYLVLQAIQALKESN